MNLRNLLGKKQQKPEPEYFLALEIHESLIKSVVWEVLEGEPSILNSGSYESWEDEESLINGVDASLTQAIKPINSQPKKVVLGLPDSWLLEDKIHPSKNKLISRVIRDLALEPIGMVTITQAITHYLKKKEGIPPTAILVEVYGTKAIISVIELGNVKAQEEVARSGDLPRDVEEGLARMEFDRLPARFLLTNGGDMVEESQQLLSYPWQERLPSFKHHPKVEILPIDFSIKAIALTGGTEAVQYLGVELNEDSVDQPSNIVVPSLESTPSIEELGFAYEETQAPSEILSAVEDETSASGAVLDPDEITDPIPENPEYAFPQEDIQKNKVSAPTILKHFSLKKISLPKTRLTSSKLPLIIILTIPLVIIGTSLYYFLAGQAEVIVHVTPQKISRQIDIAISDTTHGSLPTLIANKKTVTGSASESIATTGETTVGENATGTITIFNRSVAPISLKSGASIGSENGKYYYSLAESITIASKSADLLSGSEIFGKAEAVKVVAKKIGAEYNLSKSSTFTVDNFSNSVAYAVAESDFTGGTSRTARAVSKADQDKLLTMAFEKIKSQTQQGQDQGSGYSALALSDIQYTTKKFDHNVGDEASTLSLEAEGSLELLVYSQEDLYQLISSQLQSQIPPGSVIAKNTSDSTIENPTKSADYYTAKVNVNATIMPTIDQEKYISYIRYKNVYKIRDLFSPIPGFNDLSVRIKPKGLPILNQFFPSRNIKINIVSD